MPGADALGTPAPAATPTVGVVSDEDHRLAMAGMVATQTSSLAVRTGVMWGPGTTALVTGTSATGTMTVSVAPHHAVTTRGTADGIYLGPNLDAATTVNIAAAPGSNSRIDVVYVKQNDTASTVSADTGSTQPIYGAATGTAAVSPTKPAIPVGALELATVTVAAGATSTNGAGVTITNTARQTVARGARIPVRNQAERDALTAYAGLEVYRLDTGAVEQSNAANTAWVSVYDPAYLGQWVDASISTTSYSYGPGAANAWETLTGFNVNTGTVPAGRMLEVDFRAPICNAGDGFVYVRLLINSAEVDTAGFSATWSPVRLSGSLVPSVSGFQNLVVQAQRTGATGDVRAISAAPLRLRYRIV